MEHVVIKNQNRKEKKLLKRIDSVRDSISMLKYDKIVGNPIKELDKILDDYYNKLTNDKCSNLLDFYKNNSLYKYWKISINNSLRYIMYPYEYNDINMCLFALYYDVNEENYISGLRDEAFSLDDGILVVNDVYEFEEVTEEEFRKIIEDSVHKPLDSRLWKLKYRDHKI